MWTLETCLLCPQETCLLWTQETCLLWPQETRLLWPGDMSPVATAYDPYRSADGILARKLHCPPFCPSFDLLATPLRGMFCKLARQGHSDLEGKFSDQFFIPMTLCSQIENWLGNWLGSSVIPCRSQAVFHGYTGTLRNTGFTEHPQYQKHPEHPEHSEHLTAENSWNTLEHPGAHGTP